MLLTVSKAGSEKGRLFLFGFQFPRKRAYARLLVRSLTKTAHLHALAFVT